MKRVMMYCVEQHMPDWTEQEWFIPWDRQSALDAMNRRTDPDPDPDCYPPKLYLGIYTFEKREEIHIHRFREVTPAHWRKR